jgi:hypothetical protein
MMTIRRDAVDRRSGLWRRAKRKPQAMSDPLASDDSVRLEPIDSVAV